MWIALFTVLAMAPPEADHAKEMFETMEAKLAEAKSLDMKLEINIEEGELPGFPKGAELAGTLAVSRPNQFRLEFHDGKAGGGEPFKMLSMSDGSRSLLSISGGSMTQRSPAPKNAADKVLTLVARPGILLSQLPLPEVAVANEKERFPVSRFGLGEKEKIGERDTQRLDYQLGVKGQNPTFAVTVWIDLKSGLPVKRRVTAGDGKAKLVYSENYTMELNGELDPTIFELPGPQAK